MDKQVLDLATEVKSIGHESKVKPKSIPDRPEEKMLLGQSSGAVIANYLEIPELAVEVQRAVWQVERSLKAKQALQEEKAEMESAHKPNSNQ